MVKEKLFDIWGRRNPKFEIQFEEKLLRQFTEYGGGSHESMTSKGKILGAGYELYIYAFFIGLYSQKQKPLTGETKVLGQPIQFWGNLDSKKFRKAYPKLREYIFAALIANSDELNLIDLEKGVITEKQAVDYLIKIMENYTNYGFYFMLDQLSENPNIFYKSTGFLDFILDKIENNKVEDESSIIEEL